MVKDTETEKIFSEEMKAETDTEFTEISGKAKRKTSTTRQPKIKAPGSDEIRQKIYLVFSMLSKLFGKKNVYAEKDFTAEAEGVSRLSAKFEIIAIILTMLDPVFVALSLASKWVKMPAEAKTNKPNPAAAGINSVSLQGTAQVYPFMDVNNA